MSICRQTVTYIWKKENVLLLSSTATLDKTIMGRHHQVSVTVAVKPLADKEAPSEVKVVNSVKVDPEIMEALNNGAESAFQQGTP